MNQRIARKWARRGFDYCYVMALCGMAEGEDFPPERPPGRHGELIRKADKFWARKIRLLRRELRSMRGATPD